MKRTLWLVTSVVMAVALSAPVWAERGHGRQHDQSSSSSSSSTTTQSDQGSRQQGHKPAATSSHSGSHSGSHSSPSAPSRSWSAPSGSSYSSSASSSSRSGSQTHSWGSWYRPGSSLSSRPSAPSHASTSWTAPTSPRTPPAPQASSAWRWEAKPIGGKPQPDSRPTPPTQPNTFTRPPEKPTATWHGFNRTGDTDRHDSGGPGPRPGGDRPAPDHRSGWEPGGRDGSRDGNRDGGHGGPPDRRDGDRRGWTPDHRGPGDGDRDHRDGDRRDWDRDRHDGDRRDWDRDHRDWNRGRHDWGQWDRDRRWHPGRPDFRYHPIHPYRYHRSSFWDFRLYIDLFRSDDCRLYRAPQLSEGALMGAEIWAADGTFLGVIAPAYEVYESIANPDGPHGDRWSPRSIWNHECPYGSYYSSLSAWDPDTWTPPRLYRGDDFIGYVTVNTDLYPRVGPLWLARWLMPSSYYDYR